MQILFSASYKTRWIAEFIEACEGLGASDRYTNCVKAAIPLPLQDFVVDLCAVASSMEGIGWRRPWDTRSLTGYSSCVDGRLSSQALQGALLICCLDTYVGI